MRSANSYPLRCAGIAALAMGAALLASAAPSALAGPASRPADEAPQVVKVDVGKSRIIQAPWPVTRVSVTDPKIADVQVLTPTQVMLMGKALGSTDLIMWSADEKVWQARVDVHVNLENLKADLAELFPEARLQVSQSRDMVIVAGELPRAYSAEQLHRFFETAGYKYLDMTRLAGVQQVQLQVRMAEVSRSAVRALGFNAFFTGSDVFGGLAIGSSAGPLNPVSIGPPAGAAANVSNVPFQFTSDVTVSPAVTLFGGLPRVPLEFFIQALAENQYMRILAEPTLVALSGEEASFLAGGEIPIPVVQGTGTGTTAITIEYKEFGIRLRFRPLVMGEGKIRLHVAPEVSEISSLGAIAPQGLTVPSIITRKAETTLELRSGQTFGMAGLISRSVTGRNSRLPWIGDIPILGALFRSVRYTSNDTELVVLVTAHLVEPLTTARELPLPGHGHKTPTDWELFAEGRIEGRSAKVSGADSERLMEMGFNRLKGPGAWATYETGPARSQASLRRPVPATGTATAPAAEPAGE